MLAAGTRMRRRDDFATAVRRGQRAGRSSLVVHMFLDSATPDLPNDDDAISATGPRIGFVVGRAVGGAVTRNTVRRRLRHLIRDRLGRLPQNARVVVRALPPAGSLTSAALAADLDAALERLLPQSAHAAPGSAYIAAGKG